MTKFKQAHKIRFIIIPAILFITLYVLNNVYFSKIYSLPDNIYVSYEEIEESNKRKDFGELVKITIEQKDIATGQDKAENGEIIFKLFGIIPIKKATINILPEEDVYIGGCPIGLAFKSDGAVVISNTMVLPESSKVIKNQYFKNGDVIKKVNGTNIHSIEDITKAIENTISDKAIVTYQSENKEKSKEIELLKDDQGKYKLGIWVKDNFSGIGTLTFVKQQEGKYYFAALGHPITNGQNENVIPVNEGEIYNCSLIDIVKGERNSPGELRCVFIEKNKQGDFIKNTDVGIFGELDSSNNLIDQNLKASLGGRLSAKPGKAKIISSISGISEEYEIEIIKTNYQSRCADKSIVFRVTDKKLIDLTGGIVQGMSGSPIIQDGKIIGAVTHVFVADPSKGYGVYSDWMLEQLI